MLPRGYLKSPRKALVWQQNWLKRLSGNPLESFPQNTPLHIHAASSAYHPLLLDHIHPHWPFAFDLSLPLPLILYLFSEDLLSITFKYP